MRAFGFIEDASLWLLIVTFAAFAMVVWFSGTNLSKTVDAISRKTGTGQAVLGSLLLGGVTSLPEVVTTITASSLGNADISVNNLFGGVALQVTILCAGDFILKNRSITSIVNTPVLQVQALIGILLLSVSSVIIVVGDVSVGRVGLGSILVLILFVTGFYIVTYIDKLHWWQSDPERRDSILKIKRDVSEKTNEAESTGAIEGKQGSGAKFNVAGSKELYRIISYGSLIIVSGYIVVRCGESLAQKTGIDSGLVGALFVALATSLPELSTTITAVRVGKYKMAFSNIFGTNIFTVGFVFLADVFFVEGAVLNQVNQLALVGALLGIVLTTIYTVGLSMRFKRTVFHVGFDSLVVLITYMAGMFIMSIIVKG